MTVLFEKWGREIDNPSDSLKMFGASLFFGADTVLWTNGVATSEDGFGLNVDSAMATVSALGLIVSLLVNRAWVKIRA